MFRTWALETEGPGCELWLHMTMDRLFNAAHLQLPYLQNGKADWGLGEITHVQAGREVELRVVNCHHCHSSHGAYMNWYSNIPLSSCIMNPLLCLKQRFSFAMLWHCMYSKRVAPDTFRDPELGSSQSHWTEDIRPFSFHLTWTHWNSSLTDTAAASQWQIDFAKSIISTVSRPQHPWNRWGKCVLFWLDRMPLTHYSRIWAWGCLLFLSF